MLWVVPEQLVVRVILRVLGISVIPVWYILIVVCMFALDAVIAIVSHALIIGITTTRVMNVFVLTLLPW